MPSESNHIPRIGKQLDTDLSQVIGDKKEYFKFFISAF